jgi:hypothetical protein
MSPLTYTSSINTIQSQSYSWNYLLRMGLTDRVEFRLYGNGLSWQAAGLGQPETTGFAPLVFDTKIHFFEENKELFIPATGLEVYIQTPWGSPAFDAGTQPGITLLFLNSLPWGWEVNWNVGLASFEPIPCSGRLLEASPRRRRSSCRVFRIRPLSRGRRARPCLAAESCTTSTAASRSSAVSTPRPTRPGRRPRITSGEPVRFRAARWPLRSLDAHWTKRGVSSAAVGGLVS